MPHAPLHHRVRLTESVKLVLLLPDVGPLDNDEDEGAHPEEDTDPAPGQGGLYQPVLQDGLCPRVVGVEVVLVPVAVVVVEVLHVLVVQLLVVVGVGEDGPAGYPRVVRVLAEGVPHLPSVAPELVVVVKPLR